jgi:hypothetical protein
MHVENQRKLLKREQAGLNCAITFHHCTHSSIVPPEIVLDFLTQYSIYMLYYDCKKNESNQRTDQEDQRGVGGDG